jgi:hypothetical protein
MFKQIFFGLIGTGIGILMVLKTEAIYDFTGQMGWIEEHFRGFGGTRMFIKLLGILIIFLSLLYMTGMLQNFMVGTFGKFFGGTR